MENHKHKEDVHSIKYKKGQLIKSFTNPKDPRAKCCLDESEYIKQQKLESRQAMKKLLVVTFIAFFFMVGEIVGGYFSGSIAIITDAVHQFSDVAGFLMSFFSVYLG